MIEERQSSIQKSYDLLNLLSKERFEILQVRLQCFLMDVCQYLTIMFRIHCNCLTSTLSVTTLTSG